MTEAHKPKKIERKPSFKSTFTWVLIIAAAVLVFRSPQTAWYILLVALGFGAVIMIHEFGHFIVAKLSGIKVEAFSIGFPPTLLGIQKTEKGLRIRILPGPAKQDADGEPGAQQQSGTEFTFGKGNGKASDTEYRIGMVPFGGFVKMMGQEDAGAAEATNDPRSLAPAAVGDVQLGSPAYNAGIRPGDRIVEVNGERFVDFTNVAIAPALSAKGKPIHFVVEKPDGTRNPVSLVAEQSALSALPMRSLGIEKAETLRIEPGITDVSIFKADRSVFDYGVLPGDVATAVDGKPVEAFWELRDAIRHSLQRTATVTFSRTDSEIITAQIPLYWQIHRNNFQTEFDLCHVLSMTPRLKIASVPPQAKPRVWRSRIRAILGRQTHADDKGAEKLQEGDIIVKVGDTANPTYQELREATIAHEDRWMPITVLREEDGTEREVAVHVFCEKSPNSKRVTFGIVPELDADRPVYKQSDHRHDRLRRCGPIRVPQAQVQSNRPGPGRHMGRQEDPHVRRPDLRNAAAADHAGSEPQGAFRTSRHRVHELQDSQPVDPGLHLLPRPD